MVTPKPLVMIGEYPILWHIMKTYSAHGFNEFVICLGYKGYLIKEYFANYFLHQSDVTFDFSGEGRQMTIHNKQVEDWKVTLVNTGLNTQTGGRIKRIQPYVKDETFMLTYGDALSNIDINELVKFHNSHDKYATVSAVTSPTKFGVLEVADKSTKIKNFKEKPTDPNNLINGGFFVLNPEIFDYIKHGDGTIWESGPLEHLVKDAQIEAFRHKDFWMCMDTLREKRILQELWKSGNAAWKVWEK